MEQRSQYRRSAVIVGVAAGLLLAAGIVQHSTRSSPSRSTAHNADSDVPRAEVDPRGIARRPDDATSAESIRIRGTVVDGRGIPAKGKVVRMYSLSENDAPLYTMHRTNISQGVRANGRRPEAMGTGDNLYSWYGYSVDSPLLEYLRVVAALESIEGSLHRFETDEEGVFSGSVESPGEQVFVLEEGETLGGIYFPSELHVIRIQLRRGTSHDFGVLRLESAAVRAESGFEGMVIGSDDEPVTDYAIVFEFRPWEDGDGMAALIPGVERLNETFRVRWRHGDQAILVYAKGHAPRLVRVQGGGSKTREEVRLEKGMDLHGIVRDQHGQPVEGATVSLRFSGVTLQSTTSTSTGAFLLGDVGGNARLEIRCEHPECDPYSVVLEGKSLSAGRFWDITLQHSR